MTNGPQHSHALIVGVGLGLGVAVARRFGREGFALTLVARDPAKLGGLAAGLRAAGLEVQTVAADAADTGAFRTALETLARRVTPSVVVYNAAVVARDGILTSDAEYLLNALTVDVLGAITTAQVFTPAMTEAGAGTLLITGGGVSLYPDTQFASLSIGKAALRAATSLLHDELKSQGVHAVSVTIGGAIEAGTALDPDRIADAYWQLHTQPAEEWNAESVLDGR